MMHRLTRGQKCWFRVVVLLSLGLLLSGCAQKKTKQRYQDSKQMYDACGVMVYEELSHDELSTCLVELKSQVEAQEQALSHYLQHYKLIDFSSRKKALKKLQHRLKPWQDFFSQIEVSEYAKSYFQARNSCSAQKPRLCMLHYAMSQVVRIAVQASQRQQFMLQSVIGNNQIYLCNHSTEVPALIPFRNLGGEPGFDTVLAQIISLHRDIRRVEKTKLGCDVFLAQPKPILFNTTGNHVLNLPLGVNEQIIIWCHDGDLNYTPSYPAQAASIHVEPCRQGVRKLQMTGIQETEEPLRLWVGDRYFEFWVK